MAQKFRARICDTFGAGFFELAHKLSDANGVFKFANHIECDAASDVYAGRALINADGGARCLI